MFVSSYSTYIHPNTSERTARQRFEKQGSESQKFNIKSSESESDVNFKSSNLPIDYILKSNTFSNKQELELQKQQLKESSDIDLSKTKNNLSKFNEPNSLLNAKNAYESNSEMFSLFQKPHPTLDQTPKIDLQLPKQAQEVKEINLRHSMVNTYIQNDRYYQITA